MANNTDTKILEAIEWGDQAVQLKEFLGKFPVPNIVKVTKGQYRNIGFAKQVCSHLYLYSLSTGRKILAENVKLKEGKRAVLSDHKYAIPLTYQGWYEVLSEDGKAVKAIESVKELASAFQFTKNASYLVRENIKALLQNEGGDLSSDNAVVIDGGDIISVVGEIRLTQKTNKGIVQRKFMSCLDKNGETVYLDFDQKGLFSPVAGQQNISGVHTIHSILQKFRLPITVRLVHGIIPTKLEKHFTGVFKLLNIYSDETAFMYPFKRDSKMVPVSTREPLKIVAANNFEEIKAMPEFDEIHTRCDRMYNSFMNSIHLLFSMPEPDALATVGKVEPKIGAQVSMQEEEEDILFDEVEDIYQYVRDGGPTPPAPRPRPQRNRMPPLPDKKASTKAKLAFLGKSFANKFSAGNRSTPSPKEETVKPKEAERKESTSAEKVTTAPAESKQKATEYTNIPADDKGTSEDTPDHGKWDWTEPIYEPLEKIRSQKKLHAKQQEFKLDKSPELLSDPMENFSSATETATFSKTDVRQKVEPSVHIPPDPAVQNLRQVYKQHSVHESGHASSGSQGSLDKGKDSPAPTKTKPTKVKSSKTSGTEDIVDQGMRIPRPDYEDNQTMDIPQPDYEDNPDNLLPPPVPPKHFHDTDLPSDHSRHSHSSGSDHVISYPPKVSSHQKSHTKPKTNSITVMNNRLILPTSAAVVNTSKPNAQDFIRRSSQKHLPRGMSTTVHIEGPNSSPVVVGPSRMSVVSPTQGMSHPPYVAVARVGDGYDEKYSNGRHLQRTNSDHARRKLASMYL